MISNSNWIMLPCPRSCNGRSVGFMLVTRSGSFFKPCADTTSMVIVEQMKWNGAELNAQLTVPSSPTGD